MDKPTTDPATRVAARLAAEIIKQMDTLTAEQVGIIAHALGMDPDGGCPETFTPGRIGDYRCSLPAGHGPNHDWIAR